MSEESEFQKAIVLFKNIMYSNVISNINNEPCSKIGATFIGIKTNMSGKLKLHTYVLLTPFVQQNGIPYCPGCSNVHLKDIVFNVPVAFFKWLYKSMNDTQGMVLLEFESDKCKWERASNFMIQLSNNCAEPKLWLTQEFDSWFENKQFNNIFTITLINPYMYMVPFPMNPIIMKSSPKSNNFVVIT
jgi:hypothetical protein